MADQFARGVFAKFGASESPFRTPNGMEDNLRLIDDHLGLYTLAPPETSGSPLPIGAVDGSGQIYSDGTYAVLNGGEWKTYPPRRGIRAQSSDGSKFWLSTGSGWIPSAAAIADVTSLMSETQREDARNRTAAASGIAAKINAAAAALALLGGGDLIAPAGTYRLDGPVELGFKVRLIGEGSTSDSGGFGATTFIRAFAGEAPTIWLRGDDSALLSLSIDNNLQGTGECWQITGSRCRVLDISWYRAGGDGALIGAVETTPTINANLWVVERPIARYNAGAALLVHNPRAADAIQSATTTAGSPSVTLAVPNPSIRVGQTATGTGIAAHTRVLSISGTSLVLDTAATGSGTNTLSFKDVATARSATTIAGSTVVTLAAPDPNVRRGQTVIGTGIAADTLVKRIYGTELILDTAATGSGTNTLTFSIWPEGAPDCNAGRLSDHDFSHNGHGVVFGNSIDNAVIGGALQSNTGKGLWLKRNARGHAIYKPYTEANGVELQVDRGATKNHIAVNRFVETSPAWVIDDDDNHIEQFGYLDLDAGISYWWKTLAVMNKAAGGEAKLSFLADVGEALYAQIGGKKDVGAGGRLTLRTRSTAGVVTDRLAIGQDGAVVIQNTAGLLIGKPVVDISTPGIHFGDAGSGSNTRINMVGAGDDYDVKFAFYNGGGYTGGIITQLSGTSYTISSDGRLKIKIGQSNRRDAFDSVMDWPICDFVRRATGLQETGAIAHELQEVLPEAVTGEKDAVEYEAVRNELGVIVDRREVPLYQGIDWSKAVPKLVLAVQFLGEQVHSLQAEISSLRQ